MTTQAATIERRANARTPARARWVLAEVEAELSAAGAWRMAPPARRLLEACRDRCRAELRAPR